MSLDDRPTGGFVEPFIGQVKILFDRRANSGERLRLLAGLVKAPLRIHRRDLLVALENVDDRPLIAVIRIVFLGIRLADQGVRADGHLVAIAHFFLFVLIERRSKNSDDHNSHAEVDNISAVAARVAMPQVHHRRQQILAGVARDHAAAADKFRQDSQTHQRRQHGCHQRVEVSDIRPGTHPERDHQNADCQRA